MDFTKAEHILPLVEKPARYIGGEWNSIVKTDPAMRFALCFPDVYEIGMSHLGSRILYHCLNQRADIACERAYAPWPDMERLMRENDIPVYTMETKTPLGECDIVGFSLLYEMCYTGVLTMLDVSGIPLRSKDRTEDHPLIVCGGPCACNPEPIAPFMDAVMLGDGEEIIVELCDVYKECKDRGLSRLETLRRLAGIQGMYVPTLYEVTEEGTVPIDDAAPAQITRRVLKDLDSAPYIGRPVVPCMDIVHDRVTLEIMRGCTRGCRFCQAGYIYRPIRERKTETLLCQAKELVAATGYDEISLMSLSSGDYSEIHQLIPAILDSMGKEHVNVALPSLRVDSLLKEELQRMNDVRKAGLTFAPEAGTQRLRDVINKNITEEDIFRACRDAFEAGWTDVKLYFMIGLPTETDEDIVGIAELCRKISGIFYSLPKEQRGKGLRISASASTFVPKPHTAFQWVAQVEEPEIRRRQQLLKNAMKGIRGVEFHCHLSPLSVLEAAYSRGDRKLGDILEAAFRKGCRFDSWSEHYKPEAWKEAFDENGTTVEAYAERTYSTEKKLPWSHIDYLVTEEYLLREYHRALQGQTTRDCRQGCNGCFGGRYADLCRVSKE